MLKEVGGIRGKECFFLCVLDDSQPPGARVIGVDQREHYCPVSSTPHQRDDDRVGAAPPAT
jgi:hypothetical protein